MAGAGGGGALFAEVLGERLGFLAATWADEGTTGGGIARGAWRGGGMRARGSGEAEGSGMSGLFTTLLLMWWVLRGKLLMWAECLSTSLVLR